MGGGRTTHPRHKCDDVVFLVLDNVFGKFLLALLRAAQPHRPRLQLLLPPTHAGEAVAAAGSKIVHISAPRGQRMGVGLAPH